MLGLLKSIFGAKENQEVIKGTVEKYKSADIKSTDSDKGVMEKIHKALDMDSVIEQVGADSDAGKLLKGYNDELKNIINNADE